MHAEIMDSPGFEPGTLRMQSGCDTTTPQSHAVDVFRSHGKRNYFIARLQRGSFRELVLGILRTQGENRTTRPAVEKLSGDRHALNLIELNIQ